MQARRQHRCKKQQRGMRYESELSRGWNECMGVSEWVSKAVSHHRCPDQSHCHSSSSNSPSCHCNTKPTRPHLATTGLSTVWSWWVMATVPFCSTQQGVIYTEGRRGVEQNVDKSQQGKKRTSAITHADIIINEWASAAHGSLHQQQGGSDRRNWHHISSYHIFV